MNETDFMTRAEAAEMARRLDAEDARASHRLAELEATTKQIGALTLSVQKLADSVEQMTGKLSEQSRTLADIEGRPAQDMHSVKIAVITAIATFTASSLVQALIPLIAGALAH